MTISNRTLVKIAAIGGIATCTMGFLARNKIQQNIRDTSFCKDGFKLVRAHPAAVNLLGEPIKVGSINIDDKEKNFCENNKAQYEISLKGSKQKGILYLWAERESDNSQWNVTRLELEAKNIPGKRLVITSVKESI